MNDYFEDLSYELREEVSDLKEQLGALKSIIRQTYKAIGCSDDIIEGEDWGGLPSRVACLKAAVDLGNHQELDILHDRPHKEVGRARAARVVRAEKKAVENEE